jgi:hypothetical protein
MSTQGSAYRIQFQKGMGLAEFQARYGSESQCREALFTQRYPQGFRCRFCGAQRCWKLKRPLLKCAGCRTETSLTAGTLFHCTKLPLHAWFLAIYLFTQTKTGLSTVELKRHLGVNIKTASLIQHKLMETMKRHETGRRLSGTVRITQARLDWGPPGVVRRSRTQSRFLLAAQTNENGGLVYARIEPIPGFRTGRLHQWIERHTASDAEVLLRRHAASPYVRWHTRDAADSREIPPGKLPRWARAWDRILAENLCSALAGIRHRGIHKYRDRFLALFQFRLNHRFDLAGIAEQLIMLAARSSERPRSVLMTVESQGQSVAL